MKSMSFLIAASAMALSACQREERAFSVGPPPAELEVALSPLSPGDGTPVRRATYYGKQFEGNAYHLSEGKRLFGWYNCNGCHSNGGGGSGPALMDAHWVYGSDIENIVATVREGRPNGMPSFRGKIPDQQIWQIAAFVRSLSGNVPRDAAPGRNDDLFPHTAENQIEQLTPITGGTTPPASQAPQ
jgi:cytochrome c oxidase cbb3-type subunit 3